MSTKYVRSGADIDLHTELRLIICDLGDVGRTTSPAHVPHASEVIFSVRDSGLVSDSCVAESVLTSIPTM